MAWTYLIAAGCFEIGWPIGLKWAQAPGKLVIGGAVAVASLAASGALLFLAQREISLGTSYAVWTANAGDRSRNHRRTHCKASSVAE